MTGASFPRTELSKTKQKGNTPMKVITWFQIPATDLERAVKFYREIVGASFHRMDNAEGKHAFFALDTMDTLRTGGEIVESSAFGKPGQDGVTIYLNAPGGVDAVLAKVPGAGGKVLVPKTSIGENGFYAIILDTEGNRLGLHSV
jgi:predicted enzyme related to lactoylglutathione lyase